MTDFDLFGRRAKERARSYREGLALIAEATDEQRPTPDLHLVRPDDTPPPAPARSRRRAAGAAGASMLFAAAALATISGAGSPDPAADDMADMPAATEQPSTVVADPVSVATRAPRGTAGKGGLSIRADSRPAASGSARATSTPRSTRARASSTTTTTASSAASSTSASSTAEPTTTADPTDSRRHDWGHGQRGDHGRGVLSGVLDLASNLLE